MEPLSIIRRWIAAHVGESGKSPDDPEVLEAINESRRLLYTLGDWKDVCVPITIQPYAGQVTLPFWADVIKQAWHRHSRQLEIDWYNVAGDDWPRYCGNRCEGALIDLGDRFASFASSEKPFRIKVIPQDNRDRGIVLRFHAISEFGEPVILNRVLQGAWEPVVSDPINDKWVRHFTYCEKPETHDRVQVWIYDPVRKIDQICAVYEPHEINPHYRRYHTSRYARTVVGRASQIVARVRKKFVELVSDDQLVDIHTDALIHACQAITARRNRDQQTFAVQIKSARDILDREIQVYQPTQTHRAKMSSIDNEPNLGFEGGECFLY